MPRYQAEKPLFVGIRYFNAGEEFESDDLPGKHWLPLDKEGETASQSRPPPTNPRHAALVKAREVAKKNREQRAAARAAADNPTGLRGRKDGQRTETASSAKDRPLTLGKSVAEQHTDGEEPTRP